MKKNQSAGSVLLSLILIIGLFTCLRAQPVIPLTNEISYFKNVDDAGVDRGQTLQIISINVFDIGTEFILEFTGDFNWNLDLYEDYDYYLELSLVKPVYKSLSVNYQRIYGTFYDEPINQFGLRLSLFTD